MRLCQGRPGAYCEVDALQVNIKSIRLADGFPTARATSHPYFVCRPIAKGFAAVEVGAAHPLYTAHERGDAGAVVELLNRFEPGRYTMAPTAFAPPVWTVSGPDSGPYVSQLEILEDEADALRRVDQWSRATGHTFTCTVI